MQRYASPELGTLFPTPPKLRASGGPVRASVLVLANPQLDLPSYVEGHGHPDLGPESRVAGAAVQDDCGAPAALAEVPVHSLVAWMALWYR